jgi:hypothetical protein
VNRPGSPLTQVRSEWSELEPVTIYGVVEQVWRRRTGDGLLTVFVGLEPQGWHLSISFADHRGQNSRYPRWDEIAEARYRFTPAEVTMALVLPPPEEFVDVHATTFHLHQIAPDQ